MGFYLRKGFSFGPLRLNLSRSGLGASFGVKGARIGVGPRGSYVHMGRGGLYYRQTLTPASQTHYVPSKPDYAPSEPQPVPLSASNLQEIRSSAAATLSDSSATELLKELDRVKKRTDRLPIVTVAGGAAIIVLLSIGASWWAVSLMAFAVAILAVYARHFDVLNGTAILNYSLDSEAAREYSKIEGSLRQLAQCQKVWHIDATAQNADVKHHAGASTSMERKETLIKFSRPPKVQCNLQVPTLSTKDATLYFFPDRLLVYDSSGIGAISYGDLKVEGIQTKFVEHEGVPRDSRQIDRTWQYVNKKGGPDRRFANNRELPVMQYGMLAFSSAHGLKAVFMFSRGEVAANVASALTKTETPAKV